MHKLIPLLFVLACAAGIADARAQDSGFYAMATLGNADTQYRPGPFDVVDGDDNAWQLGAGYRFAGNFAVELSYHDFGTPVGYLGCPPEVLCIAAFSPSETDVTGWSGQIVGYLPLTVDLSLVGRAGILGWETDGPDFPAGPAQSSGLDESGADLVYSAGLSWQASPRFALQAVFERVELDIDSAKLGVLLRF